MADQLDGPCFVCDSTVPRTKMAGHLETCVDDVAATDTHTATSMLLRADAVAAPHWLFLLAPTSATLTNLDAFFRKVWLECCGHLSEFNVDGTRYAPDADEHTGFGPPRESMDIQLNDVIADGSEFGYTYDFRVPTRVTLRCHGEVPYPAREVMTDDVVAFSSSPVRGIARNDPPPHTCGVCDETADEICSNCFVHGEGFVCQRHRPDHDCDHPTFLPVINSPRTGICGYTGPSD